MRLFVIFALLLGAVGPCFAQDEGNPHERPFLGVRVLPATVDQPGLVIEHVVPNSTAEAMGVKNGDVLTSINGVALQSRAELKAVLAEVKIGDAIAAQVKRAEEVLDLNGEMKALPGPTMINEEIAETVSKNAQLSRLLDKNQSAQERLAMAMLTLSQVLENLPTRLDTVAKEFKEVYPEGVFEVKVQIHIRTGPEDEEQVLDLSPKPESESAGTDQETQPGEDEEQPVQP